MNETQRSGRASRGEREPTTNGVRTARNAVSDTMEAVGDVVGATVHVAADVGEDVVHGVGRVARTAVEETTDVLTSVASGLRNVLRAGVSGRSGEPTSGHGT
jgi:phage-related protein